MSVATGFNFQAYSRDLVRESHRAKDNIAMSVLSSHDMRKLAVVECNISCGREIPGQPWKPVTVGGSGGASETLATLWDTRMGNFNMRPFPVQACATCAEVNEGFAAATRANDRCAGHYGLVSMPAVPTFNNNQQQHNEDDANNNNNNNAEPNYLYAYSPLLFDELVRLVRCQCYICNDFRASKSTVFRYLCAFTLFDIGLVGEALHFLQAFPILTKAGATRRNKFTEDGEEILSNEDDDDEDEEMINNLGGEVEEDDDSKNNNNNNIKNKNQTNKKSGAVKPQNTAVGDNEDILMQKMERHVAEARDRAKRDGLLPKKSELESQQRAVTDIRNDLVKEAMAVLGSTSRSCRRCSGESPALATKQGQIYANWSSQALTKNVANSLMTAEQRAAIETEMIFFSRQRVRLDPSQVRFRLYNLFNNNEQSCALLTKMYPHLGEPNDVRLIPRDSARLPSDAYDLFFLNCVLVPPLHLRLAQGVEVQEPAGKLVPDDCTRKLSEIINFTTAVNELLKVQNYNNNAGQNYSHETAAQIARQLESNLCNLQLKVTELYTRVLDSFAKKEGLFRNNMMGKRVNQACRSVISPDFTVEPNQLLLPRSFARRLSFPETVTTHSAERFQFLKRCVINGPYVYPGAVTIEIRKPGGFVEIKNLSGRAIQEKERAQLAKECFALVRPGSGYQVIVHRHVVDEDRVIFNRQPTLHKVSMMSYRARVLSGLKTIRFHYVSAKSFNADFDGDEMNVHVPQGIECRAELDTIMDANLNYLLPTSGKPVRGLIQDHNGAGVLLAARDKFFTFDEFVQLALLGIGPYIGVGPHAMRQLEYVLPVPAVIKPQRLWTGKQIFSVLFRFITMSGQQQQMDKMMQGGGGHNNNNNKNKTINLHGISSKRQTQTYASSWAYPKDGKPIGPDQFSIKLPDNPVIVLNSELLVGVLDKSQTGPTNLSISHIVYDVFGPHHVGVFFGALGRLLTYGLQREGFSMGMDDMLMNNEARRSKLLREIDIGVGATEEGREEPLGYINKMASELQKHFFPLGLRVPFPVNQLVMMTITGAKGSPTNAVQMNLLVGQQTFDSKRIAPTLAGRTLPSFFVGDQRARAGGFAMGRFLSGIRPAEYTVTAMAGRVGLIDTAIKTARSGELERCLMKGLESVKVHWGGVVRNGDGALIQPRYGGDGLDPLKAATLKEFDMLSRNAKVILSSLPEAFRNDSALKDDLKAIYDRTVAEMLKDKSVPHDKKSERELSQIIKARLEWMRIDAGEPVGVLASQAIGEPSTQMTLNTFHSVGTTVSHVSQGIPRLRELMLHASVKSPAVFLPIISTANGELDAVEEIKALMTPLMIAEFLPSAHLMTAATGHHYHHHSHRHHHHQHPEHQEGDATAAALTAKIESSLHWSVSRPPGVTEVVLALAFDSHALTRHRLACRLSPEEHVDNFRTTLKKFATRFRGLMLGKRNPLKSSVGVAKNGEGAGVGADALLDGADFGREAARMMEDNDDCDDNNNNKSNKNNDDEELDEDIAGFGLKNNNNKKSDNNKKSGVRKNKHNNNNDRDNNDNSSDDDSDDSDNNSEMSYPSDEDEDEDDEQQKQQPQNNKNNNDNEDANNNNNKNKKKKRGEADDSSSDDEESDNDEIDAANRNAGNVTYDTFADIVNEKLRFTVAVAGRVPAAGGPVFTVGLRFNLPSGTLGVVPDMVREALECTKFHSTFPQVEQVSYHAASAHQKVAQLVFKGEGCRLRQIAQVVAPYSVLSPGIAVDQMTSSDFRDVLNTFGVEAAYHALLEELKELFKGYSVDHRHLSLVAEVATHHGLWKPFRFSGIAAHSSSPLYQMTVAASGKFLRNALVRGVTDSVESVSASIMTGEKPRLGTASAHVSRNSGAQNAVVQERLHSVLKPMGGGNSNNNKKK